MCVCVCVCVFFGLFVSFCFVAVLGSFVVVVVVVSCPLFL